MTGKRISNLKIFQPVNENRGSDWFLRALNDIYRRQFVLQIQKTAKIIS
jgi:hypothetical protein